MTLLRRFALLFTVPLLAVTACQGTDPTGPAASGTHSDQVDPNADLICNPGQGFPRPKPGCPEDGPHTGWLTADAEGGWLVEPFKTYLSDAEGRGYAEAHHLEFPFDNDHRDVSLGEPAAFAIDDETLCTGVITVDSREPLLDHPVACSDFDRALDTGVAIPVVWWNEGGRVVQFSELFRS